jgi:hypothetical protein
LTKLIKTGAVLTLAGLVSACNPVGTAVGAAANITTGVVTTTASTAVGIVL